MLVIPIVEAILKWRMFSVTSCTHSTRMLAFSVLVLVTVRAGQPHPVCEINHINSGTEIKDFGEDRAFYKGVGMLVHSKDGVDTPFCSAEADASPPDHNIPGLYFALTAAHCLIGKNPKAGKASWTLNAMTNFYVKFSIKDPKHIKDAPKDIVTCQVDEMKVPNEARIFQGKKFNSEFDFAVLTLKECTAPPPHMFEMAQWPTQPPKKLLQAGYMAKSMTLRSHDMVPLPDKDQDLTHKHLLRLKGWACPGDSGGPLIDVNTKALMCIMISV